VRIRADLHIHSCTSPCAGLDMSPQRIVDAATRNSLTMIALTDHNTAAHTELLFRLCPEGLHPLAGMEITTQEEVHVLALFDRPEAALDLEKELYLGTERVYHDPALYGDQPVVDEDETIVRMLRGFLGTPTRFPFADIGREIRDRGGIFIPAHIDRPFCSVTSQLGFLPQGEYDAVEVIAGVANGGRPRNPPESEFTEICASDAHHLPDVGRRVIEFEAERPGLEGLRRALESRQLTYVVRQGDSQQ
jgi:PHP family Zn ribbon phosphoesterase